jgi:hypothetical protein
VILFLDFWVQDVRWEEWAGCSEVGWGFGSGFDTQLDDMLMISLQVH